MYVRMDMNGGWLVWRKKVLWKYFPKIITDMAQQGKGVAVVDAYDVWLFKEFNLLYGKIIETIIVTHAPPLYIPKHKSVCTELFSANLL